MSSTQLLTRSTLVLRHNFRPVAFWPKKRMISSVKETALDIYQGRLEPLVTGINPVILRAYSTEIIIPSVARLTEEASKNIPSNRHKKREQRQKEKNAALTLI